MSPNWRWCLKIGVIIVLIDVLALTLDRASGGDAEALVFIFMVDQVANLWLFGLIGFRTGLQTGRVTAAAEAGVVTSVLPAIAAVLVAIGDPIPGAGGDEQTMFSQVVGAVALNIALGGVTALLCGWIGSRGRRQSG